MADTDNTIHIKRGKGGHICPECGKEGLFSFDAHSGSIRCQGCGFDTFGCINVVLEKSNG